MSRRTRADADLGDIAGVAQRLAVLLAAGVPPNAAWGYLPESGLAAVIAAEVATGTPVPDAIVAAAEGRPPPEAASWRGLAAAWAVATRAGASLAPTLRDSASALRDQSEVSREIRIALAAPVATARLVIALPVVGVLLGLVLGIDTIGILATTPIGWTCVAVGCALLLAAAGWNARLVRAARPVDPMPGLRLDLVAIAVSGGGSFDRALANVEDALRSCGVRGMSDEVGVAGVLELSRRAGVPAAELLRSEAREARRSERAAARVRALRLGVRLMLPLGLCVLPAFMVLGVVPMLVAVISTTVTGF